MGFSDHFLEYHLKCKNKQSSCIFFQNSLTNRDITLFLRLYRLSRQLKNSVVTYRFV